MHGNDGRDCRFCDTESFRESEVYVEGALTFFASDAFSDPQVLPGAGIICPIAHRESPFDLTEFEWSETQETMRRARALLDDRLRPDGYNLIWNVGASGGQEVAHVHLHLIPRFHDEPLAGRGARWHLKQDGNRRPDPLAVGRGDWKKR